MPLPPNLTASQVENAVRHIEREAQKFLPIYWEQKNLFSAVVGILGALALHSLSPYEQNQDRNLAATRFPDLILRGSPKPPPPNACLESKASVRPWTVDSHYDHSGWYIVWRYLVDPTRSLGKPVVVWRVDCNFIEKDHWRYQGSKAGPQGGGRTHTFTLANPRELFEKPVYEHPRVAIERGKPVIK